MTRAHRYLAKPTGGFLVPALVAALLVHDCIALSAAPAEAGEPPAEGTDDLQKLPPEKLPPRTRQRPDPEKDKYERGSAYVWVEEVVTPGQGEDYEPKVRITENYLRAYLARAGFRSESDAKKATYRVEGSAKLSFHSSLNALGRVVGWKYRAEAWFLVFDSRGDQVRRVDIPELFQENVKSEESAVLHTRRYLAKIAWDNLFLRGEPFAKPGIMTLFNALPVNARVELPGQEGRGRREVTTEEVIDALADRGLEVVPFALTALTDERVVTMESDYPGLEDSSGRLRVYHIADKVLEEIFQKVSRMGLETSERDRLRVIRGWEIEWRRFCPPFDSFLEKQEAARKKHAREGEAAGAGKP